jgi:hypothetical protein
MIGIDFAAKIMLITGDLGTMSIWKPGTPLLCAVLRLLLRHIVFTRAHRPDGAELAQLKK